MTPQQQQILLSLDLTISETDILHWLALDTPEQLSDEQLNANTQLGDKKEELQTLVDKHEEVKGKILQSQEQVETLRSELVESNRKLDSKSNEHDLLKSLLTALTAIMYFVFSSQPPHS